MAEKETYVIGQSIHLKASSLMGALEAWFHDQFVWVDEVLAEAKKTMAT